MELLKVMKKERRLVRVDLNWEMGRGYTEQGWGRRKQKIGTEKTQKEAREPEEH